MVNASNLSGKKPVTHLTIRLTYSMGESIVDNIEVTIKHYQIVEVTIGKVYFHNMVL